MPFTLIYAVLFGITMKIADLHNEHKLKSFKGAGVFFGFIWGILGILLILSNNIRKHRFGYDNSILIQNENRLYQSCHLSIFDHNRFSFLRCFPTNNLSIFLYFFLVFGSLKDYIDDVLKRKDFERG